MKMYKCMFCLVILLICYFSLQTSASIVISDPCDSFPCHNGGTCDNVPGSEFGFVCTCAPFLTGISCNTIIDPCDAEPCQNGGSCSQTAFLGGFKCECPDFISGDICDDIKDPCLVNGNPCENGGTCAPVSEDEYTCTCSDMFSGDNCEIDVCTLPRDKGEKCGKDGGGKEKRFYYSSKQAKCKSFRYNGCKGNENRFKSKEACNKACKPKNN